jgi:hypothetical protein
MRACAGGGGPGGAGEKHAGAGAVDGARGRRSFTPSFTLPEAPVSSNFPNLTVVSHPLIRHKLAVLRDKETSKKKFKELVDEIATLMAYEVTRDLPVHDVEIETRWSAPPRDDLRQEADARPHPARRAGMVDGVARLMPSVRVGHIGLYRDHETLEPVDYYFKIPGTPQTSATSSSSTRCWRRAAPRRRR